MQAISDGFKKWGGRLLGLALLGWAIHLASRQWHELPGFAEIHWLPFLVGWGLVGLGHLLLISAWQSVLHWLGVRLPYRECFSIFSIAMLGRYLPGKIMVIVGKVAMLQQRGVEKRTTLYSIGWELALIALAAGLLCLAPARADIDGRYPVWLLGWAAAAGLALLVAGTGLALGWRRALPLLSIVAQYLGFWVFLGVGFLFLSHSLATYSPATDVVAIVRAYAIVHMASIAVILVPGGLGVRELGLQWALQGTAIGPVSAVVAVLMRAVVSSFEIGYASIGMALHRRREPDWAPAREEIPLAESAPTE